MSPAAAPARKFTFDLDLGRGEARDSVIAESAVATMLSDARTAGFAEGFSAGEQSVAAKAAKQMSAAASSLADHVAQMAANLDDTRKETLADAVALAASIARKLATALLSHQPTAEIEALISECLASLDGVPHLVIRCNPQLADDVREIAQGRIATSGFSGRLVVMGDPEIAIGDGRIEWVDGGLVRDMAALSDQIDSRIAAFLAARGINRGIEGPEELEQ
jgi:flagellar assembly protein FliH